MTGEGDREGREGQRGKEKGKRAGGGWEGGRGKEEGKRQKEKDFLNIHTAGNGPEHSQDSRIQAGVTHAVRDLNT